MWRKIIFIFLINFLMEGLTTAQSPFENWSTLNIKGKINPKWTLAIEGEQRFNHPTHSVRYFHTDLGVVYKVNDDLSIGGYYRELYELKGESRVRETRPHLDLFYKFHNRWKVRVRNEYQIKECDDNLFRFRLRPSYTYKINETFSPFIQTEGFFVGTKLVRNRFNPGLAIKLGKMVIEPGYMLESNNKGTWSHIHIFWLNTKIKFSS